MPPKRKVIKVSPPAAQQKQSSKQIQKPTKKTKEPEKKQSQTEQPEQKKEGEQKDTEQQSDDAAVKAVLKVANETALVKADKKKLDVTTIFGSANKKAAEGMCFCVWAQ